MNAIIRVLQCLCFTEMERCYGPKKCKSVREGQRKPLLGAFYGSFKGVVFEAAKLAVC